MSRDLGARAARPHGLLRRRASGDEGAALLLVLMVMLVIAGLAIMITSAVVSQAKPTAFSSTNSQNLYAAETGIQVATSQLRTAVGTSSSGAVYGSPASLPCSVSGSTGSTAGAAYSVGIGYFSSDPTTQDADWRLRHALACTEGHGLAVSPSFALLTSKGYVQGATSTAGKRTLTGLYSFKIINTNIAGGLLYTYAQKFCVQADSATAGSYLHYVAAVDCVRSAPLQSWQWDTDYRIRLSSTVEPGPALCLTGGFSGTTPVTLSACVEGNNAQLFGFNSWAHFQGQNSGNTDAGSNCLGSQNGTSALAGVQLVSSSGLCGESYTEYSSFSPETKFGAGGAGVSTHQLVNYQQFGRCLDVNGKNINTWYEIIYPCKQDPTGGTKLDWNHKYGWTEPSSGYSAPQTLTTKPDNDGTYCLTTPVLNGNDTSPAYPRFKGCVAGQADQQWVRSSKVTGSYAASYTFTDTDGRCLSVGSPVGNDSWSSVVVSACTGGPEQKWDAAPNDGDASVSNFRELKGGS